MRWLLQVDTRNGVLQPYGAAKTTKERDSLVFRKLTEQLDHTHAWRVLATDTRTKKVIEMSLALRRRTAKPQTVAL